MKQVFSKLGKFGVTALLAGFAAVLMLVAGGLSVLWFNRVL